MGFLPQLLEIIGFPKLSQKEVLSRLSSLLQPQWSFYAHDSTVVNSSDLVGHLDVVCVLGGSECSAMRMSFEVLRAQLTWAQAF